MTASFVHRIGLLLVTAALLACGASSPCEPPQYAEYSLDATGHPESIECFYGCLPVKGEKQREACFSRCEGVIATTTHSPCSEGAPALCRSYGIAEPTSDGEGSGDNQAGEVVGEILGFAIRSGIEAASSDDDDDDDDRSEARAPSSPRRRASPSPAKKWTSSSKVSARPSSFRSKAEKR